MNPHRIKIEKGCVVDASHKDEWWTGLVIKELEDDKFLVFFDSLLDIVQFERKSLRIHFDEQSWTLSQKKTELLRRLTEECVFGSGTMVEVSCKRDEVETVWVAAMVIKEIEIESDDEKKCIVKFCDKDMSFVTCRNSRPIKIVDLSSVRPTPPPFSVKEYQLQQCVEVLHWKDWRQAKLVRFLPRKWCVVLLKGANKESSFKLSDVRPLKVWEDGIWKTMESPISQASGTAVNANTPSLEAVPPVTMSPVIAATPWKQNEAETQRTENNIKQENETSEDNNLKRKREQNVTTSTAHVEETKPKKTAMVLPFEKKLPIWKTLDSMEVFKTPPQSPHFNPLLERSEESSREMAAFSLMFTYATLIEELKGLQLHTSLTTVIRLSNSISMLENYGFDVKAAWSYIHKLLSLREKHTKKMEQLKDVEQKIAKKESETIQNKRKILELQKLNEEAYKEIAQMKSSVVKINKELKDMELQN